MSNSNDLVLDGNEVKLRLQAERFESGSAVHVDWLRFTCLVRNVVPSFKSLVDLDVMQAPHPLLSDCKTVNRFDGVQRSGNAFGDLPKRLQEEKIAQVLQAFALDDPDHAEFGVLCQALELAKEVCEALGPDFQVCGDVKKGFDFYKYRWPLERNGFECGWVGFLSPAASPDAPQNHTLHVNLFGYAMTFAKHGARELLADIVELHEGKITRCDLALDFFNGMARTLPEILEDYRAGLFDVRSRRPGSRVAGDWANGAERSIYVGCKKSGKETNIYEKGDQLFGRDSKNPWVRVELRYGNKLRVLPVDMLRRPADFFAGASDWHQLQLVSAGAISSAAPCPQEKALPMQTVAAEVSRNVKWALTSAAPTIAAAFKYMTETQFLQLCNWEFKQLPGRLRKFKDSELAAAFQRVVGDFSTVGGFSPALF